MVLKTENEWLSQTVQDAVSEIMRNELPEVLQQVFDELATEDEIIRIDSLQLDLGTLSLPDIKQSFTEKIAQQIREAIIDKKGKPGEENAAVVIRKEQSLREGFLYFLQSGLKPWFGTTKNRNDWQTQMQQTFQQQDWQRILLWLKEKYRQQPVIIERLVSQFSDGFLQQICDAIFPCPPDKWDTIYTDLIALQKQSVSRNQREILTYVWLHCFQSFLANASKEQALYSVAKAIFLSGDNLASSNELQATIFKEEMQTKIVAYAIDKINNEVAFKKEERDNGDHQPAEFTVDKSSNDHSEKATTSDPVIQIKSEYVSNSGIILLHPFLEMYFDELSLLKERKFTDITASKKAVLLLHYLSTGETKVAEFDVLLQKILCSLSPDETLPDEWEISDIEKEESDKLLQSVINYWTPLKNTSIEGLRSTFLQRDAKLEKKENGWLLTIEQKTVDVLLDKLPWGFSTIQLPWMKEMISVDWC